MIDFDEKAIIAVRRTTDDGRFALFTNTDVLPHWEHRFWGVILDTGGDGFGLLVRYGTVSIAPSGWTLSQLFHVVQARMELESARAPSSGAVAVLEALRHAIKQMPAGIGSGGGVSFQPDEITPPSPYCWTVARNGDLSLPLCPDPESRQEGVTPELVIIVLDQALKDWSERAPHMRRLWSCRKAIRDALAAEILRVRVVRGEAGSGTPPVTPI